MAGDLLFIPILKNHPQIVSEQNIDEIKLKWLEYITKILTPNSSGGFDLQYSKDVE